MKRLYFALLLLLCAISLFAQDDLDEKRYIAEKAYWSFDTSVSYALYSELDSIEPITNFCDLWYYYFAAEVEKDSLKSKELLFRLVARGLDRGGAEQSTLSDLGVFGRPYWHELDSIISLAESKRCQPFIDSLAKMREIDQAIRQEPWTEENRMKMRTIDSTNTAKLQALVAQYGFPTWELVGRDASNNAWLIAQHSWSYLPWYYEHYKDAVKNNNADNHNLAYMEDRYLMQHGRPQIYGSQMSWRIENQDTLSGFYPIIDVKNVDKRRLAEGLCPIEYMYREYLLSDSIVIFPYYLDYASNYYVNNTNMYIAINGHKQGANTQGFPTFYFDRDIYSFPRDHELVANWLVEADTVMALQEAKKMVLCGKRLDEEWRLPQVLMDSVRANYDELRTDYERMIAKDDDLMLNSITSFDTLVKVLAGGSYPRYTIDAWNGHIKELISDKSETLTKNDYEAFFEWLFKQVEVGNYHLFDYAELYDEVYYRLYRKSYFGQKLFGRRVAIFDLPNVDQRRSSIHLPPLRTWLELNGKPCPKGYDWDGYLKEYL